MEPQSCSSAFALATGTGKAASAPGVFVDHLRPTCWCQQRGAPSQTGSGRRSSIRDPYLGKVGYPGNLKFDIDFRSVYQTLIRDWLQGDAATVLGATYPELPFINKA